MSTPANAVGEPQRREIGAWLCTAFVVGNIIGVGIFVLPASLAPYGLNAILAWVVTIAGCSMLAVAFAGLARAFPEDDGPYAYTRRAFGDGLAFTVMWAYWVATFVTNAVIAVGVVGYLSVFIPVLGTSPVAAPLLAVALIWLFVLTNLFGVRAVGWVQMLTTVLKLLPLLGIIVLGIYILCTSPGDYVRHLPPNPISLSAVSSASTLALYAMLGIETATIPACRVCNPRTTIPRATVIGAALTGLIYMCVSSVPVLLIPQQALSASSAPFADLFVQMFGAHSGQVISLFVVISGLGCLNGWTLMLGDITQTIARSGNFPRVLARQNSRGSPTWALIVTGLLASFMLVSNYSQSISGLFAFLSVVVTAANLPLYFACSAAILMLVRRGLVANAGGRAGLWITIALLAFGYCIWVSFGIGLKPMLWALGLCAAGIPIYWLAHLRRRREAVLQPSAAS